MKFNRNLGLSLLGSAIIFLQSQIAAALTPSEVNAIAKEFTVLIGGDGVGSGVIYEKKGNTYYVLTNQHVVSADGRYEIQTADGTRYAVYRSRELPGLDLAILEFTSNKNYKLAAVGNSDQVREGMPIYVVGWADAIPGITKERSYQFTDGTVRSRLPQGNNGYTLVYNNEAIPGMSGGPVVDDQARVIGINGKAKTEEDKDGGLKLGLRLGIPINTFLTARTTPGTDRGNTPAVARRPSAEEFISLGGAKADKQDFQGAIQDYNRALQIDPKNPDAYLRRGNAYVQLKNWQSAFSDFNQLVRLNPKNAFAFAYRGYIQVYLGNFQGAFSDSDQSIRLAPDSPTAAISYGVRGVANLALGNKKGALNDIDQAGKLSPDLAKAFKGFEALNQIPYDEVEVLRGLVRGALGDKPGAIRDFQQAAAIYQRQGRKQDYEAIQGIIKQIENGTLLTPSATSSPPQKNSVATASPTRNSNPTPNQIPNQNSNQNARSHLDRAIALYNQGDRQAALDNLNQATRINPRFSQAWHSRGYLLGELGRSEEAIASFDKAIQINNGWLQSSIFEAYFLRGNVRSDRGDYRGAKTDYDAAISFKPKQNLGVIYAMRGLNFQRQGNNQAAIADFNQAIRLEPNNPIAFLARGYSYHLQQDYQGATAAYEKAIAQNAKLLPAVNNLGLIKYELQDTEGAIRQFQAAIAIDNRSAEPQLAMAVALYTKGERQQSLQLAENALRLDKRFANRSFLKANLWGNKLIADTQKLLQNPKLRAITTR